MATTLVFRGVKPASSTIEEWQSKEGKFKDVPRFGLSEIKEFKSKKGNMFLQCESLAFVSLGQFARVLQENPNAKFGTYTQETKTVKKNGKNVEETTGEWVLQVFDDPEGKWFFMLDADGKLHLIS